MGELLFELTALAVVIIAVFVKKFIDYRKKKQVYAELPYSSSELMQRIRTKFARTEAEPPSLDAGNLIIEDASTLPRDTSSVPQIAATETEPFMSSLPVESSGDKLFDIPFDLTVVVNPSQLVFRKTNELLEIKWSSLSQPVEITEVMKTIALGASYIMTRIMGGKSDSIWQD